MKYRLWEHISATTLVTILLRTDFGAGLLQLRIHYAEPPGERHYEN